MPPKGWKKHLYTQAKNNPVYRAWSGMMRRCFNVKCKDFARYGGRGITVCNAWRTYDGFCHDMLATYSPGLTIDRIDVNGDYTPANCQWATMKQQSNNRHSNRVLTNPHTGEKRTLAEWVAHFELNYRTVSSRINILKLTDFDLIFSKDKLPRQSRQRV